jgi:hypothetical protein
MNDKVQRLRQRLDEEARRGRITVKPPSLMPHAPPLPEVPSDRWPYGLLLVVTLCAIFWIAVTWLAT